MRYVHMVLCLLMIAFVGVQYNDPDGPLWAVYYLVPAAWAAVAAFRPALLRTPRVAPWLWATAAAWFGLMLFYWPTVPDFWKREVYWVEETAREGMGMMIAFAVVAVVLLASRFGAASEGSSLRTPSATRP